jgi:ATP-binding cassette subfamily C protein CydD
MNLQFRLLREARSLGLLLPGAILFGFLVGALVVLQSFELSKVISGVFLDHHTLSQVLPLLRGILFIVLFRVLFTILNEVISGKLAVNIKIHLSQLLLEKLNRLGPAYLKREQTGELATTALQGVDALDAYFSQFLPQVLISFMLPVTILIVVFPMDLLTGFVLLITAPLIPMFMVLIGWAAQALTKRQWLGLTRLGAYFLDTLQGIATLKALGRSRDRANEVREVSEQYRQATMNVLRVTFLSALILELVATISTAVVAVEIGLRLLSARIEFQQAFFILLIAPEFYIPLRNLSARYHAGMTGVTAANRIYEILDTPEPGKAISLSAHNLDDEFDTKFVISLKDLEYRYPGQSDHSLKHLNLDLIQGKHYALVGSSGSGKSTLAGILMRFLDPESGFLTINGKEAAGWSRDDWRQYFGWVPQRPMLFNTTLRENITLGKDNFTLQEFEQAIKSAFLESVINSLPMGLDTQINESGARLSGGEAQRVALARAFLKNPRVLILDEPSSHMDIALEQNLTTSINHLMTGRTTLTIAHRLSTVRSADDIILLENGELIDQGNHESLMQKCKQYRDLINAGEAEK